MTEAGIPRFAPGVRFRYDKIRESWALLAPERLFQSDEQAAAILQLIDGERSIAAIVEMLAQRYDAPRDLIAGDVLTMLEGLAGKGLIRT